MDYVEYGDLTPSSHFHHEHINYFSVRSIDNLMGKFGFERIFYKSIKEDSDIEVLMLLVYCKKGEERPITVDNLTSENILDYLNHQKQQSAMNVVSRIQEIEEKYDSIIVYGFGSRLMQLLREHRVNLFDIVDSNSLRWGHEVVIYNRKYTIKSIDEVVAPEQAVFLVCVNSQQYVSEICATIRKKYRNDIVIL